MLSAVFTVSIYFCISLLLFFFPPCVWGVGREGEPRYTGMLQSSVSCEWNVLIARIEADQGGCGCIPEDGDGWMTAVPSAQAASVTGALINQ